jgi:voltage-gated potassium channel
VHGDEPEQSAGSGRSFGRLAWLLLRKPLTARRATVIISAYTLLVTLAGGTLEWLLARRDFASFGAALWWAVQTVTTVGYGDVVPSNTEGRLVGVVVMLSGIGFLTVITAAVTASLIEAARRRLQKGSEHDLAKQLEEIQRKLSLIETHVTEHDDEP